jgi:hypothetical protein
LLVIDTCDFIIEKAPISKMNTTIVFIIIEVRKLKNLRSVNSSNVFTSIISLIIQLLKNKSLELYIRLGIVFFFALICKQSTNNVNLKS